MLNFLRHKKTQPISIGARYSNNETMRMIWEVISLFKGIDGTPYAEIMHVGDSSRRKTVAQSALEEGIQYRRL